MKFATNVLRINAALFTVFGACFIVAPAFFAATIIGAAPGTPSAAMDMRATYGGMGLGIGLLFWVCANQRETVRAGLVGALLVLAATALARGIGFIADGAPNAYMPSLLCAEVLFAGLLVLALKRLTD